MKGLTTFLLEIIILVVSLGFIFLFLSMFYLFRPTKANASMPSVSSVDTFDYATYLLSPNPIDNSYFSSPEFCYKLKNAVKWAVMTGKPYKVDEIAYGSNLYERVLFGVRNFPLIGNCPDELMQTEVASGLNQTVCKFKTITSDEAKGNDNTYGGISDAANLYFDNCFYHPEPLSTDIKRVLYGYDTNGFVGPQEDTNHLSNKIYLYYSPDYLYIQNGDYSHPSNNVNNNTFSNAYNGPGKMNIYVGMANPTNGNCTFNIYFCPKPAIATDATNSTISIFRIFRDLELVDLKIVPYYVRDLSQNTHYLSMSDFSKKVYYWNYYDVKLDNNYRIETILNAIKSGMDESVYSKNYFWAQPHWDITRMGTINKNNECWDSNFDTLLESDQSGDRTRSIRFNCIGGGLNTCSGNLTIKMAMRRDFKNETINGTNFTLNYMSGVISFCDN